MKLQMTPYALKRLTLLPLLIILGVIVIFPTVGYGQKPAMAQKREKAEELFAAHRLTEALPLLEELAEANPEDAGLQFQLGFALLAQVMLAEKPEERTGLRIRARNAFVNARKLGDESAIVKALIESIPIDGTENLEYSKNPIADAIMRQAEMYFTSGKMKEALEADQQTLFEIERPSYRTYLCYGIVTLLLLGLVGLIYSGRAGQLRNIAEAKEMYTRELLESQERERSRLAMEIHDSLGQNLVVIRNRALLAISKAGDSNAMLVQLQEISDAAAAALHETREIAHALHPYQIEALGLGTALHTLIDKFESSTELAFTVMIPDLLIDIPNDVAISIYRITQEWLANIVKHASARNVSVFLSSDESKLSLNITDDGIGFDPQNVKRGLGLMGIEERARMIGSSLQINSIRNSGSSLDLRVDLTGAYGEKERDNRR